MGSVAFLFLIVLAASWAGTGLVLRVLVRREVFDHPNERSSHARKTPRGGGLAVVAVVLAAWLAVAASSGDKVTMAVAGLAAALAVVSFIDDLRTLPPLPRLAAHLAAVGLGVALLPAETSVFQGLLPPALDRVAAAAAWVWFVNLYNFMDGIDGITGVETACIGGGLALLAGGGLAGGGGGAAQALILAAAAGGFLIWNWAPARIFLGDVGSIPLGFLLGWLLLRAAGSGSWAPALILPLYYLADATITLGRRALRGEKVWKAHREHFYQRAVQTGRGHGAVAGMILAADLCLVVLAAVAAAGAPLAAVAGSAAVVALLLTALNRGGGRPA